MVEEGTITAEQASELMAAMSTELPVQRDGDCEEQLR